MKNLNIIKTLIMEEMKSIIDNWEKNTKLYDMVYGVPISEDDVTGDVLYLFVGFTPNGEFMEYSYSFMLLDVDNNPKTNYMTTRDRVKPFLPSNKSLIFPLIKELTRKLLNKMLPEKILRRTVEFNNEFTLKRYDEITNIMVNEYGYSLTLKKDEDSTITWILTRTQINESNFDMETEYKIIYNTTLSERLDKHLAWIPEQIKRDRFNS